MGVSSSRYIEGPSIAGMKLKPEKCSFMMTEVEYLGHKISAKGLQPTNQKVRAITEASFTYQCVTAEIIFGDAKLLWEIFAKSFNSFSTTLCSTPEAVTLIMGQPAR